MQMMGSLGNWSDFGIPFRLTLRAPGLAKKARKLSEASQRSDHADAGDTAPNERIGRGVLDQWYRAREKVALPEA
jgi:hypothetical protein